MPDEHQHAPSGSIVVGHDGSENSFRALHQAVDLAEAFAAPLVIVRAWELDKHVPEYTQILSGAGSFPEVTDAVRAALVKECEPIVSAHPTLSVSYLAALGAPAEILTSFSAQALVLVLGSRGRGGVTGLLLGSVADRCVHQASRPVLIIRPPAQSNAENSSSAAKSFPDEALPLDIEPGSVIVGHDGSVNSDQAIKVGFEFAHALGLPLAVIRTWSIDHIPHGLLWKDGYVAPYDEVSSGVREELIAEVSPLSERYGTVSVSYFGVVGDPGESLVRASNGAGLLVIGSRGRGGFRSLLLGSVSAYCAHRAGCPTLVVPRLQQEQHAEAR